MYELRQHLLVNILDLVESLIDIMSQKNDFVTKKTKLEYVVLLESFVAEFVDICDDLLEQYLKFNDKNADKKSLQTVIYDNILQMLVIMSNFQQKLEKSI